jgi:hypothetical protein
MSVSSTRSRVAAWSALAAYVAITGLAVELVVVQGASADSLGALGFAAFAAVGVLIALRRPRNAVGWLLLAIAILFAAVNAGEGWVEVGNPGRVAVAYPTSWGTNVWFTLGIVVLPLVFPDGRLLSRRWRLVLWLAVADLVLGTASAMLKPGPLELQQSSGIDNPFGIEGGLPEALRVAEIPVGATALLLAGASVVLRFRRSQGLERQQLKWFALVGVLTAACLAVAIFFNTLVQVDGYDTIAVVGWLTGLALLGIGLPLATGFAIFRHRLYDVDVVIRRTLVYGALTATLGALYLGLVLLIGLAVGTSNLAIAISTLAVAALARPVRARIQAGVDQRFYRRRYDAGRTLEAFSTRLRDELDLETLAADLRGVVRDTVQPAHVSVWLRRPR